MRKHRPSLQDLRLCRCSLPPFARRHHARFRSTTIALGHSKLKLNKPPAGPLAALRLIRPSLTGAVALAVPQSKPIRQRRRLAVASHMLAPRGASSRQRNATSLETSSRPPAMSRTCPITKGAHRQRSRPRMPGTRQTHVVATRPTGPSLQLPFQLVGITPRLNRPTISLPAVVPAPICPMLTLTCQRTATLP